MWKEHERPLVDTALGVEIVPKASIPTKFLETENINEPNVEEELLTDFSNNMKDKTSELCAQQQYVEYLDPLLDDLTENVRHI